MPAAPRQDKKAEKIAFRILGVPPNMKKQKKKPQESWVNRRLIFEETSRVR